MAPLGRRHRGGSAGVLVHTCVVHDVQGGLLLRIIDPVDPRGRGPRFDLPTSTVGKSLHRDSTHTKQGSVAPLNTSMAVRLWDGRFPGRGCTSIWNIGKPTIFCHFISLPFCGVKFFVALLRRAGGVRILGPCTHRGHVPLIGRGLGYHQPVVMHARPRTILQHITTSTWVNTCTSDNRRTSYTAAHPQT